MNLYRKIEILMGRVGVSEKIRRNDLDKDTVLICDFHKYFKSLVFEPTLSELIPSSATAHQYRRAWTASESSGRGHKHGHQRTVAADRPAADQLRTVILIHI